MRAYERLLNYVKVFTTSDEDAEITPSTKRQFDLSNALAEEMKAMGMEGVFVDEHAYVYGFISASDKMEDKDCIGLIAHLDTAPDFCGENVKPQIIENYDGGDVQLGRSGRVLSTEKFPELKQMQGKTLICTDGTTLLGADDKAGIAEILTACQRVIEEKRPHGRIAVCFTPDEEIGHGADLLDIEKLGADFAYTMDGGEVPELSYETFNAAGAEFEVKGFNVHPGSAKDVMINASLVAMEINSMLPAGDVPSKTQDYEGFFHLCDMQGNVEKAELKYIIRDHDREAFKARENCMRHIEKLINEKYGESTAVLTIKEQYSNMADCIRRRMDIVELAKNAMLKAGITPNIQPIRGGTDGANLSQKGLLCPNLGTGGYSYHGPYEHITAEDMDSTVEVLLNMIEGIIA